jgi:hypothetical protein
MAGSATIKIPSFAGMIPAMNKHRLPANAAQDVLNADLRWGGLRALPPLPAAEWPDDHIASNKVFKMREMETPALTGFSDVVSQAFIQDIDITPYVHIQWVVNGVSYSFNYAMSVYYNLITPYTFDEPNLIRIRVNFGGGTFHFGGASDLRQIDDDIPNKYKVTGPSFVVTFPGGGDGYPQETITLGENIVSGTQAPRSGRQLLSGIVPIYRGGLPVAYIKQESQTLFSWDKEETPSSEVTDVPDFLPANGGELVFRINYVHAQRREAYYSVATVWRDTDDAEYEGPPSDITDEIKIPEGQYPVLSLTPKASLYDEKASTSLEFVKYRIYRSYASKMGQRRLCDVSQTAYGAVSFTDDKAILSGEEAPNSGNAPYTSAPEKATFIANSFMHPTQFATALFEEYVWVSDIFNYGAWPTEWKVPISGATSLIGLGDTAVVFATDGIYLVSGSSPAHLSCTKLVAAMIPVTGTNMCLYQNSLYYVTEEGIGLIRDYQFSLLTKDFFTSEMFAALGVTDVRVEAGMVYFGYFSGANFIGYVLETHGSGPNVTVNLSRVDKRTSVISWQSREFTYDYPINFSSAFITTDTGGSATLTMLNTSNGTDGTAVVQTTNTPFRLPRLADSRFWATKVSSTTQNDNVVQLKISTSMEGLK